MSLRYLLIFSIKKKKQIKLFKPIYPSCFQKEKCLNPRVRLMGKKLRELAYPKFHHPNKLQLIFINKNSCHVFVLFYVVKNSF